MYCRKCGNQIPDDSEFCCKCGATVTTEVQQKIELKKLEPYNGEMVPIKAQKCQSCGEEVFNNQKSCHNCGAVNPSYNSKFDYDETGTAAGKSSDINSGSEPETGQEEKTRKKHRVIKAVFIPLGILAVLAAFIIPAVYREYHLDFYYTLSDSNRYIITGYKGSDTDVKIPDTIQFTPVYMVAADAFKGSDITSVTFGKNIGVIGESAFEGCKDLKSVSFIQDYNSPVDSVVIMDCAFQSCPSLHKVDLPYLTTHILDRAFAECSELEEIQFDRVADIGMRAFGDCTAIGDLTLNYVDVGESAFSGCTGIERLSVSYSTLKMWSFNECTGLKELTFCGDLIPFSSFSECTALETVRWERGYSEEKGTIENLAFTDCTNLSSIIYVDQNYNETELTKPSDFDPLNVSVLGDPFYGCSMFREPEPVMRPYAAEDFLWANVFDAISVIGGEYSVIGNSYSCWDYDYPSFVVIGKPFSYSEDEYSYNIFNISFYNEDMWLSNNGSSTDKIHLGMKKDEILDILRNDDASVYDDVITVWIDFTIYKIYLDNQGISYYCEIQADLP